jgi:hypothetical protein
MWGTHHAYVQAKLDLDGMFKGIQSVTVETANPVLKPSLRRRRQLVGHGFPRLAIHGDGQLSVHSSSP